MIKQTKAGSWRVDHYYFDAEGKRRRKLRTFDKHKDAVAYEKEALALVQKREFVAPSKVTVGERATAWLEKRFANGAYERATRIERENHVNRYIIPAFGALPIQQLTIERIEQQATVWNAKVAAMVVNRILRTLADIMGESKRHGLIRDNPAKDAERLKEESEDVTPDKVLTKAELCALIGITVQGSMERVMVMLPALTGCRVGELLAARWGALDLDAGRFEVRSTIADPDKGQPMIFKKPKTANSLRTVPLPKELVHELRLWKFKSPASKDNDLVVISEIGRPVRRRAVYVLLKRLAAQVGIEKPITPHALRHTFASLLLADRVPPPEVAMLLGHKNSAITMRTYAHFVRQETTSVHDLAASVLNVSIDVSNASSKVKL